MRGHSPGELSVVRAGRPVSACLDGLRMMLGAVCPIPGLLVFLLAGNSYAAEVVPHCEAATYKSCPTFITSVEVGDHEEIIDNAVAGFTLSEASWTIAVRYQPAESCAIVKLMLNVGPIDFPLVYERTLDGGSGRFAGSGRVTHRTGDLEGSLRLASSSCFVPAEAPGQAGTRPTAPDGAGAPNELDDLLDRLARGEPLAPPDLDDELERLASEERRHRQAARERARQAALEAERERQRRLAEQRRQREQELASRQRQQELDLLLERQRLDRERRQREQAAADAMMTGLTLGVIGGVMGMLADDGGTSFNPGAILASPGGVGAGCDRIGERLAAELETVNAVHGNSMCGIGRGMAQALSRARNELAAMNCASRQELADLDRSIREAQATAQASCGGN